MVTTDTPVAVPPATVMVVNRPPFFTVFLPFPVACFTLALLTDIAFWRTGNLMWKNFSAWLLFAGIIAGAFALIASLFDFSDRRVIAPVAWRFSLGGILVLACAFVNNLVHGGDGWTSVVPYGLLLSVVTVLLILLTQWSCSTTRYRVYRQGGRYVR